MQRIFFFFLLFNLLSYSHALEINGSPFATEGAPLPTTLKGATEKMIVVYPAKHVWGAYNAHGRLIRWGIATAGAKWCQGEQTNCLTKSGYFRIYSLGNINCTSNKYDNAPMPYCMYFNGGEALHGSNEVEFANKSHGCVRVHISDAKWLRYHFVEAPSMLNHYRGTMVMIKSY